MKTRKLVLAWLAIFLLLPLAYADGALDTDYGLDGRSEVAFDIVGGAKTDIANSSVLQADGKLIIAGAAKTATGDFDFAVARLLSDGTPDGLFGTGGKVTVHFDMYGTTHNNVATSVTLQPDGKILVVGTADGNNVGVGYPYAGTSVMVMARLQPNGALDSSFGDGGKQSLGSPETSAGMAVATDDASGMVAIVGSISQAAFLTYWDGTGFFGSPIIRDVAPSGSTGIATSVRFDAAGRVVIVGAYAVVDVTKGYDCFVSRYVYSANTSGYVLDQSFGSGGRFTFAYDIGGSMNDICWSLAIQGDGKIVVVGQSDSDARTSNATIARVLADGSGFDPSFGGDGHLATYFEVPGALNAARGVKLQSDGKIIVSGFGSVNDPTRAPRDFGIMRLDHDGYLDNTFVGTTPGSNFGTVMVGFEPYYSSLAGKDDTASAVSIDSADRIYVVGAAQYTDMDFDMAVARLQSEKIFVSGFQGAPQ